MCLLRDNLTLPEYKAAMQKVEKLEHQAVKIEENNQRLAEQAEKLADQIAKLDEKEKDNKEVLKKHDLRADTLKTIAKETEKDTKKLKSAAVPVSNIFGGEEYVKVKKSDWDKIIDAFSRAVSRNKLLEKYEKKIVALEKKVSDVNGVKSITSSANFVSKFSTVRIPSIPSTPKNLGLYPIVSACFKIIEAS